LYESAEVLVQVVFNFHDNVMGVLSVMNDGNPTTFIPGKIES
jgi:hypothetical protein